MCSFLWRVKAVGGTKIKVDYLYFLVSKDDGTVNQVAEQDNFAILYLRATTFKRVVFVPRLESLNLGSAFTVPEVILRT